MWFCLTNCKTIYHILPYQYCTKITRHNIFGHWYFDIYDEYDLFWICYACDPPLIFIQIDSFVHLFHVSPTSLTTNWMDESDHFICNACIISLASKHEIVSTSWQLNTTPRSNAYNLKSSTTFLMLSLPSTSPSQISLFSLVCVYSYYICIQISKMWFYYCSYFFFYFDLYSWV